MLQWRDSVQDTSESVIVHRCSGGASSTTGGALPLTGDSWQGSQYFTISEGRQTSCGAVSPGSVVVDTAEECLKATLSTLFLVNLLLYGSIY